MVVFALIIASGGSSVSVSLLIMRFVENKSIKRRHLGRQRFPLSAVQVIRSLISWKPAVNFN